ncbi:hypothetical protein BDW02DRAFT_351871 [Decorospora gaudefroyi]|uniref:Uncharacterized protein n=1 Tax=Decorospora gaudefroyi TaxID=184978 RepID=A0A6A5KER3_9PLEO|nr:hypothetical protein BDW02DRAFT_351871 [Decorospora gaudefroyi]
MTQSPEKTPPTDLSQEGATTPPRQDTSMPTPPSPPPEEPYIINEAFCRSELNIIEAELANCRMTRDALSRRETALQTRRRDLENQLRRYERRRYEPPMTAEDDDGDYYAEGLYMREVSSKAKTGEDVVSKKGEDAEGEKIGGEDAKSEKKNIPISWPERRRLARVELLERDPRLRF